MGQLKFFLSNFWWSGHSKEACALNTFKLVTSIDGEKRHDILEKAALYAAVITPENMLAIKLDLGILWEKLNYMAR